MITTPLKFDEAIEQLEDRALLPTWMSSDDLSELSVMVRHRSFFSARVTNAGFLEKTKKLIDSIVTPRRAEDGATIGHSRTTARAELKDHLEKIKYQPDPKKRGTIQDLGSDQRLNLILETNADMARGFGQWKQGQDPTLLAIYPARELFRGETRKEPRNWEARWAAAGGETYGGRMIAPTNSDIWSKISRFGTPFPPFDFNSGMDTLDVSRSEALRLGVVKKTDPPQTPHPGDFNIKDAKTSATGGLKDALSDSLGDGVDIDEEGGVRVL